jgi:putative membrane protein
MRTLLMMLVAMGLIAGWELNAATSELPSKPAKPLNATDTKILIAASQDGRTEIQLGELAAKSVPSPQVRDFGLMMVNDHQTTNAELEALCSQRGIILPTELDPDHQKLVDSLAKLTGSEFQAAYVNEMIAAQKTAVTTFENASKEASDPEVKAFIERNLPVLRHHLESAEALKETGK